MESQKCLEFTVKVLKIFIYVATFAIVLGCGVLAKCCVFLMTSQIKSNRYVPYCNKDLGKFSSTLSVTFLAGLTMKGFYFGAIHQSGIEVLRNQGQKFF